MGAGDDPLGIGGGEIGREQQHARAELRGVDHLTRRILRAQLGGMRPLAQLRDPLGLARQQAPVVGDADGVDGVDVRAGLGAGIDEAALIVGAGDHGGDAHVEVGVGLGLRVQARKAVDEAGNEKFSGAIDDARAFGDWHFAGQADLGDFAFADDDNGIGNVVGGMAPIGDIDDCAAGKNQGRRRLGLGIGRNGGQSQSAEQRAKEDNSHHKISLKWIVAQRDR